MPALLLPQRRARAPRRRDPRGGEGEAGRRWRDARLPIVGALPAAARPAPAQLDPDRGLRRRALPRQPQGGARPDEGGGRRLRAAGDGLARRHDLDRGARAGANSGLGSDRRRRRRPGDRRAARAAERALHRHRRHVVRHRADHRRALRDHPDPGHRPVHAQHAAGQDRLDRRRHRLVRARQPELGPARARPRLGRGRGSVSAGPRAGSRRSRSPT